MKQTKELKFIDAADLMITKSFKKQVRLYSIVGGNKNYIQIANQYPNLKNFVIKECFNKNGRIIVYMNDYINKLSHLDRLIITSIGIGNTKPTAISNNINIKEKLVRETLQELIKKSTIRKELPTMNGSNNELVDELYFLNKNILNFYFNFIYPYLIKDFMLDFENAINHYNSVFDYQYQGRIFEEICKDLFINTLENQELKWISSTFGSYWNEDNSIEIDIVSKDMNTNKLFLGECKFFRSKPVDMRIYHHLKEKAKLLNESKIIYGLFSVTGFSPEIISLSKKCHHLFLFNNYELIESE